MRSVVYKDLGKVEVESVADPEILNPGDALVRITGTTICGSDLHIIGGHMVHETGFAIGHEWVGVITAVGPGVTRFTPGQRVTGPPAPWCGTCDTCRRGQYQRCERGGVYGSGPSMGNLGGAQSSALRVPWADRDLVLIPDEVSDQDALAVCDVLCTGWCGVLKADVHAGDTVVVLGCGPVGLSAVHTAKRLTAARRVIAVDPVESRRQLALQLGADTVLAPDENAARIINELTNGWGAESIVDAAGMQATLDLAIDVAAIGGNIAVLGIPSKPHQVDFMKLFMKNLTLWTGLGELHLMDDMMRHVQDGVITPGALFTHQATLEQLPDYYGRMQQGDLGIVKVFATV